jgi:hypothetical protein
MPPRGLGRRVPRVGTNDACPRPAPGAAGVRRVVRLGRRQLPHCMRHVGLCRGCVNLLSILSACFLVATGTAANTLAWSTLMPPWGAVRGDLQQGADRGVPRGGVPGGLFEDSGRPRGVRRPRPHRPPRARAGRPRARCGAQRDRTHRHERGGAGELGGPRHREHGARVAARESDVPPRAVGGGG